MLDRSPVMECQVSHGIEALNALIALDMQGRFHVMSVELDVTLQSELTPRTLRVEFEVVCLESLLRATKLLVLHTEEVLIRVGIEMFASSLSVGKPEVADVVIGPDVFLVRVPMLLQAIRTGKFKPAIYAIAVFMRAGNMCGVRGLVVKCPITLLTVAVGVPVADMLFQTIVIKIVPLAIVTVAIEMDVIVLPMLLAGILAVKVSVTGSTPYMGLTKHHMILVGITVHESTSAVNAIAIASCHD
ncbi:MAG: hypothetical protein Q9209_007570 [Squamulea sp. 1 TL-2023]